MAYETLTETQLRRVLEVGRNLVSEPDVEELLKQVLVTAKELTEARFAALSVLEKDGETIEHFIHLGMSESAQHEIGILTKGRGVPGDVKRQPLRLADLAAHGRSTGSPRGPSPMASFVGVPIRIRGEAFGSIYLTDRADGNEFTERDEAMLEVLAEWAAVAIDNARGFQENARRRDEFERAVQTLEATVSLARAVATETDLPSILKLIAKRARALIESRSLVVLFPHRELGLIVAAVDGEFSTPLNQVVAGGNVELEKARLDGMVHRSKGTILKLPDGDEVASTSALIVHLSNAGRSQGYLIAMEPAGRSDFTPDDELLFQSFAGSAANSIAIARDEESERLRMAIEASEQERRRWAMELHDETLQDLGALKIMHEGALRRGDPETMRRSLVLASSQIDESIISLESLIQELRPATLDLLGVAAAVESLVDHLSNRGAIGLSTHIDLAYERGDRPTRLEARLESTIYRAVQEALNNSIKHAEANTTAVSIVESDQQITIFVEDDGKGFSPSRVSGERFGLHGMRERVELVGGELEIDSSPGKGTRVEIHIPVQLQPPADSN